MLGCVASAVSLAGIDDIHFFLCNVGSNAGKFVLRQKGGYCISLHTGDLCNY